MANPPDPLSGYTDSDLIREGKKAVLKYRGELIDNCYRARLIPSYTGCALPTKELERMWANYG